MALTKNHYIYAHKDPNSDEIFYIGKGTGKRAYATDFRNDRWHQKVDSLSGDYIIQILEKDLGIRRTKGF